MHARTHTMEGVLIAKGPGIRRGKRIEGARIVDIAHTLLDFLGIAPPSDMDGRVLEEIFLENREKKKVASIHLSESKEGQPKRRGEGTNRESIQEVWIYILDR